MEALDGFDDVAAEDRPAAERFHAQHPDLLLHEHGQDLVFEAAEVSIHHIQGHLHCIEVEFVFGGNFQHAEMNEWILMASETDVTHFAGLFRLLHGFHRAARSKDAVRVFHADDLMKLHEVNAISLEPAQ